MTFDRRKQTALLLGVVGVCFVAVYRGLFTGESVYVHDTLTWYGAFHFFVENLARGVVPYWDPYQLTGTPFYPYNSLFGNLDPLVLGAVAVRRVFDVSPLALYVAFRLLRLFVFVAGQFFFFRHLTKHAPSALLAASLLLFVFPLTYFRQFGAIDAIYLTPFGLLFLARFLEEPEGPRRSLHLAAFSFVTGVSLAIYIPAFYAFNVVCFTLCLVLFGLADLRGLWRAVRSWRFSAFAAACLLSAALMAAPSLSVMAKDASAGGELFPMQRIIQRNNGMFKQLVASDVGTNNLSNRFTNQRALYNSWGEVVNLVFPDFVTFKYWQRHDLQSEIDHYIGMIPFVFALVGFLTLRGRYRWVLLAMLALNFVNGFSAQGFGNKPYNAVQRFFNAVFPPLTMYQGRENLGYFVLFYLSSFAAMGLALLFRDAEALRRRARLVIGLALGAVGVKLVIAALFSESFPITSVYDGFVMVQLALLAALVFLFARDKLSHGALAAVLVAVTLVDLVWYNENAKEYSIQGGKGYYQMVGAATAQDERPFAWFREPALRGLAFQESISRVKGALSLGLNHSLFTTKRFYDLFTNVPVQNQFLLNGMVYPVARFFPAAEAVAVKDRRELLARLAAATPGELENSLYLETAEADPSGTRTMQEFSQYPDAPWLSPPSLVAEYGGFVSENQQTLVALRNSLDQFLRSPAHALSVRSFSVNEVTFDVQNAEAGYLLYADGWSPYWKAFDNGSPVAVRVANYNSKAVYLAPGRHEVRFLFDPVHYKAGLAAYGAGLAFTGGAIALLVGRRRKGTPPPLEEAKPG